MTYEIAVDHLRSLEPRQRFNLDRTIGHTCSPDAFFEATTTLKSLTEIFEGTIELIATAAKYGTTDDGTLPGAVDEIVRRCELVFRGAGFCNCAPVGTAAYESHNKLHAALVDSVLDAARSRALGIEEAAISPLPRDCDADPSVVAIMICSTALRTVAEHTNVPLELTAAALAMAIEDSGPLK